MVSDVIKSTEIKPADRAICYTKHYLESLEIPANIRIKFSKTGSLQYISHLDLQRLFGRAAVRAGIPLWYTQGFNPHPKMVFALPLPVGVQSLCEFLDVKIDKVIENDRIKELLNSVLTEELQILEVYTPEMKFSEIGSAEYLIKLKTVGANDALAKKITEFLSSGGVLMNKHTKSGEKEIDISSLIYSITSVYDENEDCLKISLVCSAGTESLNPEYIVSALRKYGVFPKASLVEETYSILRKKVIAASGAEFR